jgi:shikimate kinase
MNTTKEKNLIYLIGMMGTGKTTIAPAIAKALEYGCTDIDREIEKEDGKGRKCKEIIKSDGIECFRSLETQELEKIAKCERLVVACGGGIVEREENEK